MKVRVNFFSKGELTDDIRAGLSDKNIIRFGTLADMNICFKLKNGLEYLVEEHGFELYTNIVQGYLVGVLILHDVDLIGTFGAEGDEIHQSTTDDGWEIEEVTESDLHFAVPNMTDAEISSLTPEELFDLDDSFNCLLYSVLGGPAFEYLDIDMVIHSIEVIDEEEGTFKLFHGKLPSTEQEVQLV